MVKACVNCKYFRPRGIRLLRDKCNHPSSADIDVDYVTGVETTHYRNAFSMRDGRGPFDCAPEGRFYVPAFPEDEPAQVKEYKPAWWKAIWS